MAVAVEKSLKALSLAESHVMAKLPSGTLGRQTDVITNSYLARLQKNVAFFLYSVDIVAEFDRTDGESKRKQITKRTKDDFLEQERKKIATLVFIWMGDKKMLPGICAYDRASQLISLQKLTKADDSEWKITMEKDSSAVFKENCIMEANRLHVTIKKSSDTFQVSSSDLNALNPELLQALMAIVSISTSQNLFREFDSFIIYKSGVFLLDPSSLQLRDLPSGTNEKYIGHGFAKGVDIVGADGSQPTIALTIDAKKTAFHYDYQNLAEKIKFLGMGLNNSLLTRYLKGVTALVYYKGIYKRGQRERSVQISSFGCPVKDVTLEIEGKRVRLADFVKQRYNTDLTDLSLPCVVTRYHGTFSPETLMIAPSQRVRVDQMQKALQESIIKASASKPSDRKTEISKLRKTINPPKELGMTVEAQPMKASARILDSPTIGTGQGDVRAKNGTWIVKKFVKGAVCNNWTLAFIRTQGDRVDLKKAADAIVRKASELGMTLGYPKLVEVPNNRREDEQTAEIVRKAKEGGSTFVMLVTFSRINNHDALKKAELDYGIVTQQIKSETAGVLHMKQATLANVLKKTNEKLGGINLTVSSKDLPRWLLAKNTLVVGMTIDHPRPQTREEIENKTRPDRPAFISWGINAVAGSEGHMEATHFSGGYLYANPRETTLIPAQDTTKKAAILRIVESFKKCRGVVPEHVLLIRRVNEGDAKAVLSEVNEWKVVLSSMGATPKFVLVTANLNHASRVFNTRLDERAKAMEQNLEAGLTVDSTITSPSLNEFIQQAHVPRQGTARPTKYTILYADNGVKISMDDIEMTMFALCHTHGVCDMTTALPTPLKISEECAKRALNLFNAYSGKQWTIDDINQRLSIQQNSTLDSRRFNA